MDLGDWSIRNWRALAGLTSALLVVSGGLAGSITDYRSYFPALGGPNGLLYDLTLKVAQPWRRNIPTVPAVFVAIDDASLSTPDLAALPRALFQPVWARLIDGLLEARARRIAFDVVFAYAGADFQVGSFVLPDYDRSLIDSLGRARDRIVLGRFPSIPPAPPFLGAVGASRVGVLDLQLESDGRVRSTAPLVRLADGRIALGFAALAAGLNVRQASAAQRILIAPYAPMTDTPTYSLGTLLDCLSSEEGLEQVRRYIEGRIVVVGTAVLGEDEHRGPTRFLGGGRVASPDGPVRAAHRTVQTAGYRQRARGAHADSGDPVSRNRAARIVGAKVVAPHSRGWSHPPFCPHGFSGRKRAGTRRARRLAGLDCVRATGPIRRIRTGGPHSFRLLDQCRRVHIRRHLAPNGLSHPRYNFSVCSHRWYQISPPSSSVQKPVPNRWPLFAPSTARDVGS